jgi:hypothetical protein
MRKSQWPLILLLAGLTTPVGRAQAPAPLGSFYGIGDLPGGVTTSIVRDATKVGTTIIAVGASAAAGNNPNLDSAAIWTFDPANPATPATLTQLPVNTLAGGGATAAAAINQGTALIPTAAFIASQARYVVSGPRSDGGVSTLTRIQPVRVERTATFPTENLNAAPFPTYVSTISLIGGLTAILPTNSSAVAISDDGSILYGATQQTIGTSTFNRAVRFDFSGLPSDNVLIPLLNAGDTTNGAAARGTSWDGSVVVGFSLGGPAGVSAFRYEHGNPGTVTAIPRLPGGTVNAAAAVSPDGNLTLVFGDSTFSVLPRNEMYLHNAATQAVTRLGSPNTAWRTTGGGMSFDGSVVAATFAAPQTTCAPTPCTPPTPARYAYFRNSQGWFRLETALAAQGVFLPNLGWTDLLITGMSRDGTLVFGQGMHNIAPEGLPAQFAPEGFVAEFAPDYLKNFNVPAVSPTDTSIVGAWVFPEPAGSANPNLDPPIVVFLADGTYFNIESGLTEPDSADGFERGRYFWNPSTQAFAVDTLVDTNGATGLSGANGIDGTTVVVSGANITVTLPASAGCGALDGPCVYTGTRVAISPGSLAGAWYAGNPVLADTSNLLVLLDDGSYYFAQDGDSSPAGDPNGVDGIEKGSWTWNAVTGNFSTQTTVDTNREWGLNAQFPLPGSQSALTVQLTPDQLRATITDGTETFTFVRVAVTSAQTVAGTNDPVKLTSAAGTTPVTITFDDVTGSGETTLEVIDPAATGSPAPPAGFSVGDPPLYYEVQTTASFTGAVSVCFNYAGISFGTGTPRLFHFEGGGWMDITTTVDTVNTMICGVTTSLSPFGIFVSPLKVVGFHSPVSQVPGAINTIKGGSTVPLKFNVYVDGVEKTDTSGLQFGVSAVGCAISAGEDPVDFTTTGGTQLRYEGGSFIQSWKTPSVPGCYLVRMTTTADGLSLNALFKVK